MDFTPKSRTAELVINTTQDSLFETSENFTISIELTSQQEDGGVSVGDPGRLEMVIEDDEGVYVGMGGCRCMVVGVGM